MKTRIVAGISEILAKRIEEHIQREQYHGNPPTKTQLVVDALVFYLDCGKLVKRLGEIGVNRWN